MPDPVIPVEGNPAPTPIVVPPTPAPVVEPAKPSASDPDVLKAANQRALELETQLAHERTERQKLQDAEVERERERMRKEGEWKELADKESKRADDAHRVASERSKEFVDRVLNAELKARLAIEGVDDLDYAVLANRSLLSLSADGKIIGLDDCVKDLRERKPGIFGHRLPSTSHSAGSPSPGDGRGEEPQIKDVSKAKMSPEEYRNYQRDFKRNLRRA